MKNNKRGIMRILKNKKQINHKILCYLNCGHTVHLRNSKNNSTKNKVKCVECYTNFVNGVNLYLKKNTVGDLYILGDFYYFCCDLLQLNPDDFTTNVLVIRRNLVKMNKDGVIDIRRVGTGYGGKEETGCVSMNIYTLKENIQEIYS
jgi:hypothetical protein